MFHLKSQLMCRLTTIWSALLQIVVKWFLMAYKHRSVDRWVLGRIYNMKNQFWAGLGNWAGTEKNGADYEQRSVCTNKLHRINEFVTLAQCTEVGFANFLSGRFITIHRKGNWQNTSLFSVCLCIRHRTGRLHQTN